MAEDLVLKPKHPSPPSAGCKREMNATVKIRVWKQPQMKLKVKYGMDSGSRNDWYLGNKAAGEGNLVKVDAGDGGNATAAQKRWEKSPFSCSCFQKRLG